MAEPFRVIVADPPWSFDDKLPDTKGAEFHYSCMTTNELCHLADYGGRTIMGQFIASDAVLFLWRVASQQQAALDVARAWGFTVKTDLVWLKKTRDGLRWFGMGRTLRAEHETCLVCTRGRPEVLNHSVRSTFVTELDWAGLSAVSTRHSAKPAEFYAIIETLFAGPYLELFGRRKLAGWTVVGDEILSPQDEDLKRRVKAFILDPDYIGDEAVIEGILEERPTWTRDEAVTLFEKAKR